MESQVDVTDPATPQEETLKLTNTREVSSWGLDASVIINTLTHANNYNRR